MDKRKVMAIGFALAAFAVAGARGADMDVGAAAQDPSKIPAMLEGASAADKAAFLKQAVAAAAKFPVAPENRPAMIANVIFAGADAVPAEDFASTLSATVCAVPFSLLPATVDTLVPGMRSRTEDMSQEEFQKNLDAAVAAVGDQGLSDDEADIYRAYVIALFAKTAGEDDAEGFVAAALAASSDAVARLYEAAMKGDYAAIFGPEGAAEVVVLPQPVEGGYKRPHIDEVGFAAEHPDDHADADFGLERPSIYPVGQGTGTPAKKPSKPSTPAKPRPPTPPRYEGQ